MNSKIKNREEISSDYKWNIQAMYPDEAAWHKDVKDALEMSESFGRFQGHIMDSPSSLLEALETECRISRKLSHAIVYSHMKQDEDNGNSKYLEMNQKAMTVAAQISASLSFMVPELLSEDPDNIMKYVDEEPALETYRFMLQQIIHQQPHVLSKESEHILSALSDSLGAPGEIFSMLNDADMDFGSVEDSKGNEYPLTHSSFIRLMEDDDRTIRKNAYEKVYGEYSRLNNTIATAYNYSVKEDTVISRLRHYESPLDQAMSPEMIPIQVYDGLISTVHEYLPAMYRYVGIRKRALGLEDLEMYDVYRPLVEPSGLEYTFEEAVDVACKALQPLGEEYVSTLRKGLLEEGWVDVYENKGKTSGAYSFGSYDSFPYILMNFTGRLNDIFTLVHEGGHSMHSYYTRKTQPYIYSGHSIFTAEVASTVNESLLIRYLLGEAEASGDLELKKYLINFYIDEFKATLFRQTMFAEFERETHKIVSEGGSLTPETCNTIYDELNTKYFGPDMEHSDLIKYEWSRIPHFYRDFYVYQYATGYSAATAISQRILSGGEKEKQDYLRFLTLGDSDYPIELLKVAGVDMSTPEPVDSALKVFSGLVDQLDQLME